MASIGIVQDKDEHYAFVSVADGKIIRAHNDCQAEKGDKVMVSCSAGRVFLYVFAIFVLPFFPAGAAFYLIYTVSTGFWLPSAAGLAVLAVFYLFLRPCFFSLCKGFSFFSPISKLSNTRKK